MNTHTPTRWSLAAAMSQRASPVPLTMGIMNITPDSFSDGGKLSTPAAVISRISALERLHVDIIDIGGESTRPGASRISEELELRRVVPVFDEISRRPASFAVSIDTMRARVAAAVVARGADIINDVSGGCADPSMLCTVRDSETSFIIGHWPKLIPTDLRYSQRAIPKASLAATRVAVELRNLVDRAVDRGIGAHRILVDPGIGFGKDAETNWEILSNIALVRETVKVPIALGVSRKRFLACPSSNSDPRSRDFATSALHSWIASTDAVTVLRAHNVQALQQSLSVSRSLRARTSGRRLQ